MGLNDPAGFDFAMRNVRIKRGHSPLCVAHHADGGRAQPERGFQNNMRYWTERGCKTTRDKSKSGVKGILKKFNSERKLSKEKAGTISRVQDRQKKISVRRCY